MPPLLRPPEPAPLSPLGWQRLEAAGPGCGGVTERLEIEPGLAVVRTSYVAVRGWNRTPTVAAAPGQLVLTLGLQGQSAFVGQGGERLDFRPGFTTAAASRGGEGERLAAAGAQVAQLRLLVQESWLERLLGPRCGLLPDQGLRPLASARTAAASQAHALALFRHRATGGMDALDCRIHALQLLAEQLRALGLVPATASAAPTVPAAHTLQRLEQARACMLARLDQAWSTAALSQAVGLSETRFKAGFKAAFGLPPGQWLLQQRMERARLLLAAGCQVAQAAAQVGYAHASNFSTAYTRHFGLPPRRSLHQGVKKESD